MKKLLGKLLCAAELHDFRPKSVQIGPHIYTTQSICVRCEKVNTQPFCEKCGVVNGACLCADNHTDQCDSHSS